MNINEMTNDQATDAMVRISSALSFVLEDEDVTKLFQEINEEQEGKTLLDSISKLLPQITALAFKKHKHSMYEIVGALSQKDSKDVGKMNFMETVNLLRENLNVIKDFFPSSASSTKVTEG